MAVNIQQLLQDPAFLETLTNGIYKSNSSKANVQQVQGAAQTGQFNTTGDTSTTGTQNQSTVNNQQQTGNTATTGTTSGTQISTGTNTSTPIDTYGLGALLASQGQSAVDSTKTSQDFLSNLIKNGPVNQQALTAQAVNSALSGPGMVGSGDNARARAAGDAASTVGLKSLDQQITAANSLGNPTALTTLVGAGNPYVGSSATTSGNTTTGQTSNTNTNTNQNTVDIGSLVNKSSTDTKENQSGTSSAASGQVGTGTEPITTTTQCGGSYICTASAQLGWMKHDDIRKAAKWNLERPDKYYRSLAGYSIYGPTLASWILKSRVFRTLWFPFAHATLTAELCLTKGQKLSWWELACHSTFHYGSLWLAKLIGQRTIKQCNPEMVTILKQNNLLFLCPCG